MELSKGAHAPVPTSLLAVAVSWQSEHVVDAHALLLAASGRVRTDRDLVFYNAPRHISQAVTLDQEPAPGTARLSVSLPRTEADIARIVIGGSLDGGTFADVSGLTVTVLAAEGPVLRFRLDAPDPVTALMFGEFYRRDGAWRFRAVGQGWRSGLAGLVTEFGVSVDDPGGRAGTARPADPFRHASGPTAPASRAHPDRAVGGTDRTAVTGTDRAAVRGTHQAAGSGTDRAAATGTDGPAATGRAASGSDRAAVTGRTTGSPPSSTVGAASSSVAQAAAAVADADSAGPRTDPIPAVTHRPSGTPFPTRRLSPADLPDAGTPPGDATPATAAPRNPVDLDDMVRPTAADDTDRADDRSPRDRNGPDTLPLTRLSRDEDAPPPAVPVPGARPVDLVRRRPDPAPPPPPPDPARADWYPDPTEPARMRWWDGAHWTSDTYLREQDDPRDCPRCGSPRRRRFFGGLAPCAHCEVEIEEFLTHWHSRAWRVLTGSGPTGEQWEHLWASLRYQRIDEERGRAALRDLGLSYVERLVTFAFADGEIEQAEFEMFEHALVELRLGGPLVEDLRKRVHRGRTLCRLREGDLPVIRTPDLHLDSEEKVHLDLPATQVRTLARGPRHTEGRLIASNKKLRFVGTGAGVELPWTRVVSVRVAEGAVVIAATSARGGATFLVGDPDYVAAALEGALRVAKRLVLTPGQRDSRSISQEIKAEVWQRDGGRCVECGSGHYLEFDHIIPLSRGGATSAANLQILCRACNRRKGARI
ncbi:TerD family protein [Nocardia farcinica]|uniref:TerD family protein n=1 Tax=Nocardia farcinica TaxID=37329 RepID=UPI001E537AC2|nr:TerD family protein [Nocardia farcinica]